MGAQTQHTPPEISTPCAFPQIPSPHVGKSNVERTILPTAYVFSPALRAGSSAYRHTGNNVTCMRGTPPTEPDGLVPSSAQPSHKGWHVSTVPLLRIDRKHSRLQKIKTRRLCAGFSNCPVVPQTKKGCDNELETRRMRRPPDYATESTTRRYKKFDRNTHAILSSIEDPPDSLQ